ncbi:MAG: hypothetical protein Q7R40_19425 [Phaeospirillum sp.]|nr:hypothetical protein [Phaeospirillum sp.]
MTHPGGRLSAAILLGMIACVLIHVLLPLEGLRWTSRLLLLAYIAAEWSRIATNARVMVGLAALLTAWAAATGTGDTVKVMAASLDTGAFFATFFANQFFLREAARTSKLVSRCSAFFVNQRPGRRYALLTLGGYLFGIILNIGVLSLLGIMIKQRNSLASAGGNAQIRDVRERRMVLALLRGFSITPLASPLSISLAVLLTAMPGLHWSSMLPLGMATGLVILGLGWLQDKLAAPLHLVHLVPPYQPTRDAAALAGITGLVLLVFFTALGFETALGIPLSRAMLVSTPLIGLGWLGWQYRDWGMHKGSRLVARRVVSKAATTFPNYRTEIAILSSAGFIGTLFSALAPPAALGSVIAAPFLPPVLLPLLAMLAVVLPALAGINPIVSVTILASALHSAPHLPIAAESLALGLIAGWSISINSSTLTASAMLLGEMVGKPAKTIVRGWNGRFTLACFVVLGAWLTALGILIR